MVTKKLPDAGFTLIEIMIVIAIIAILAAISIPFFLSSRISANEASAIISCRTIALACQSYYTNVIPHLYPDSLDVLMAPASNPPYLDPLLGTNRQKQGYSFAYAVNNPSAFSVTAAPLTPGITGRRYFFTDETGVIRAKTGGQAGPNDTPID